MATPRIPGTRRRRGAALLAAAVAFAALVAGWALPASTAPSRGPQLWIATRTTLGRLEAIDPTITHRFFEGPTAFGLGGWSSSVDSMSWASEAKFAHDLRAGSIPADVRAVMYDPENWDATPTSEQRDPQAAMRAFSTLAHARGFLVILTPHPNLTAVAGAACAHGPDETIEAAFVRCRLAAAAARDADVVEVQGQFLETDPGAYRAFVARAAAQARAANPQVYVVAGLSTNFTADPQVLLAAWSGVRNVVDGHYLAVPEGIRPQVAVSFLQLVADRLDAEAADRV